MGQASAPSINQLKLKRATASEAGLFLMVEKKWTTLRKDKATTAKRAITSGKQGSSAVQIIAPTRSDNMALKRLWEKATSLLCLRAKSLSTLLEKISGVKGSKGPVGFNPVLGLFLFIQESLSRRSPFLLNCQGILVIRSSSVSFLPVESQCPLFWTSLSLRFSSLTC